MEYHVYWLLNSSCFEIFGDGKYEPKSWWKYDIYWLLKSSCFELLRDGKYGIFWAKKLIKKWHLLITENFLFWTFRRREIWSFFDAKSWWKDHIYRLLESSCFEFFHDGKYGLFSAKRLTERWYLLAFSPVFHGLGKYDFSCNVHSFY